MGQYSKPPEEDHPHALTCQDCGLDYWTSAKQPNDCPRCGSYSWESHGPEGHPNPEKPLTPGEYVDLDSGVRVQRGGGTRKFPVAPDHYSVDDGTGGKVTLTRDDIESLVELAGFHRARGDRRVDGGEE